MALGHGAAFPLGAWLGRDAALSRLAGGAWTLTFDGVSKVFPFLYASRSPLP